MARFEVRTPVPNYTGEGPGGVIFKDGAAVISSDTADGLAVLGYFKQQGYGIFALDEQGVDEVLQTGNESPEQETARLEAEIRQLEARKNLDDLRGKRDKLRQEVFGEQGKAAELELGAGLGAPLIVNPGDEPAGEQQDGRAPAAQQAEAGSQPELLAPPAESAPVAEWRTWAVESGRAREDQVASVSRAELIKSYGADYDRERAAQLEGSEGK